MDRGHEQIITIERVIIVCSLRCPANSFADYFFIMSVHGDDAFWAAGEGLFVLFFSAGFKFAGFLVATGTN